MIIQLEHITKIYRMGEDKIRAVDDVSIQIEKNEYLAIMGPSGSGKSTLLNILGCLDSASSGVYRFEESEITGYGSKELAALRNARIGFIFQSFELLPRLNALQNVALPLLYARGGWRQRRTRAMAQLKRVGLEDRAMHRPAQLSGGQKQRVAIARAMVTRPSVLLADEPTGNLDSTTTGEILALFGELHRQGQTIIMVTHEQDVARRTHRLIHMLDGRVVSDRPAPQDATCKA